ncbi:hypothetical protein KKB40_01340 [Patescibacteria group bacterium]|nr:hypothetical protein [Patescibacteria group bacterium]
MPNFKLKIFTGVFLTLLISLFIFTPPIFSQEERSFDNVFNEYKTKTEDYKKAHSEYTIKRSQYIKFNTLKSKADAYGATLAMLYARDEVVVAYLTAIEKKLSDVSEVSEERRKVINSMISSELNWFKNHKDNLASAGTLENLVKDSDLAKERYILIEPLAYETFATISYSKLESFYTRLNEMSMTINGKIEEIKKEDREDYQFSIRKQGILDRWIFESEGRIVRGEEKMTESSDLTLLSVISEESKGRANTLAEYNKVVGIMGESRLFFNEAILLLKEIVSEIKVAE